MSLDTPTTADKGFIPPDAEPEVLDWLDRYGLHDDGSAEEDALEEPLHRWLFARYLQNMVLSPASTRQTRISCAHSWFSWLEDRGVVADQVGSSHIYEYVDSLLAKDLSHPSIASRVDTVTMLYLWGEKREYLPESPFTGFELEEEYANKGFSRSTPKQVRVLKARDSDADAIIAIDPEDVEKIIEHSGTPRLRNQLVNRLLWQTGLRCSELAGVRIENIDEEERSITVRSAKVQDPQEDHYWRTVYYQENLEYQMWEWLHGGGREGLYTGEEALQEDEGYLLLTQHNAQMRSSHISRIVKESAKRAGINEVLYIDAAGNKRWLITGHTIRHSYATYCANGDDGKQTPMPLHTLKKLMGHKSLDTTLQYISPNTDATKRHAERYGPR